MTEHTWEYCNDCQTHFVRCGYCHNNCCNGATGKLPNGSQCGCKEAYELQKQHIGSTT